jgi:hypothetical protein
MDESMIARHETYMDKVDLWAKLAAPLPTGVISWRQDGKAISRDGKHFARFVAYVDANTVRERLDGVVPGEWDLTLELLPPLASAEEEGNLCSFKARLQILGVIREDVGTGRDYKSAATDAFKRAAVRFGIAHELYAYEQNWVQVDGDGRYPKPLEDPAAAYARRYGTRVEARAEPRVESRAEVEAELPIEAEPAHTPRRSRATPVAPPGAAARGPPPPGPPGPAAPPPTPSCPKCSGKMWDNRLSKRNPKAPDFKCRDRSCDGVVWPARSGQPATATAATAGAERETSGFSSGPLVEAEPESEELDDLPF